MEPIYFLVGFLYSLVEKCAAWHFILWMWKQNCSTQEAKNVDNFHPLLEFSLETGDPGKMVEMYPECFAAVFWAQFGQFKPLKIFFSFSLSSASLISPLFFFGACMIVFCSPISCGKLSYFSWIPQSRIQRGRESMWGHMMNITLFFCEHFCILPLPFV